MDKNKTSRIVKLTAGIIVLLMLLSISFQLYAQHFYNYVADICDKAYWPERTDHYAENRKVYYLFWNARWFFPLLTMLWAIRLYSAFANDKPLLSSWDRRLFNSIGKSINDNITYVKALPLFVKYALGAMFIIQVVALGYFIAYIPYHYDEIYSYLYFSNRGALSSLVYYPVPNNHVFYNILTSQVLHLPVDAVIGMRLVSALSGIFGAYYFFKMAAIRLAPSIAAITTALYMFTYPIVMYSVEGRGYGLMIFFVIACIYSFMRLTEGKSVQKYLTIYTIAGILGFFTIPSFLYAYVPVTALLFLHFIIRFRIKDVVGFILSQIVVGVTTVLLYIPLIKRNTWKALTENNGVIKRDAAYIKATIKPHLEDTWRMMTGGSDLSWDWIMLLLGFALLNVVFKKGYVNRFYCLFVFLMILSPFVIINVHQTIPFPRTWSYMAVPICLSIGLMLNLLNDGFKWVAEKNGKKNFQATSLSVGLVVLIAAVMLGRFYRTHNENGPVDIAAAKYAKILRPKLSGVSTMGISINNLSFYLAEDMNFERSKLVGGKKLEFDLFWPNDTAKSDMIFIDKRSATPVHLENYTEQYCDNPYFIVYLRKGL